MNLKRKFLVLATGIAISGSTLAAQFEIGSVFASVGDGKVDVYTQTGTLIRTLDTTLGGFTTGSTFDQSGNFYVTAFEANKVSKFDSSGTLINANWATGLAGNESIVFDKAGDAYIGNAGTNKILKVNSSGVAIKTYTVQSNTDWIDLAADQTTLIYSDESSTLRQWNVGTDTALPNFASIGGNNYAKRIRPNGDLMVANSSGNVYRFDSAGVLKQTYATGIGSVFALNLDQSGNSFWTGATGGTTVEQIDITSGAILQKWNTKGGSLFGLSVLGEIQAGGGGVVAAVPEPETYALMLVGLAATALLARRRTRAHS